MSTLLFDKPLAQQRRWMKVIHHWNVLWNRLTHKDTHSSFYIYTVWRAARVSESWENCMEEKTQSRLWTALTCRLYLDGVHDALPRHIPDGVVPWMLGIPETINPDDIPRSTLLWMAVIGDLSTSEYHKLVEKLECQDAFNRVEPPKDYYEEGSLAWKMLIGHWGCK